MVVAMDHGSMAGNEPRQYGGDGSWRNGGSWAPYAEVTPRQTEYGASYWICG